MNTRYAVAMQPGRLTSMEARFACGSTVLLFLFHKKIHFVNFFVKKIRFLPPCRRRIGPVVPADAWFGTDRVTPVSNTRYAVRLVPASCQTRKLFSPVAAWFGEPNHHPADIVPVMAAGQVIARVGAGI